MGYEYDISLRNAKNECNVFKPAVNDNMRVNTNNWRMQTVAIGIIANSAQILIQSLTNNKQMINDSVRSLFMNIWINMNILCLHVNISKNYHKQLAIIRKWIAKKSYEIRK